MSYRYSHFNTFLLSIVDRELACRYINVDNPFISNIACYLYWMLKCSYSEQYFHFFTFYQNLFDFSEHTCQISTLSLTIFKLTNYCYSLSRHGWIDARMQSSYSLYDIIPKTLKYRWPIFGLRIIISFADDSILCDQKVYIYSLLIN